MAKRAEVGRGKRKRGNVAPDPLSQRIVVLPRGGAEARAALVAELRAGGHRVLEQLEEGAAGDAKGASEIERSLEARVQERTAALQQIKAQWEQTFDAVREPLAVLDGDYRLVRVNRAYAQALERPIIEVPGKRCFELRRVGPQRFVDADEAGHCSGCPVSAVWASGEPGSATLLDERGRRWIVAAYPVRLTGQTSSVVVHYRDVSLERARQDRLARESKATAVGNLAGAVAHELNSPMTSIMVFSEALARKTAEGSELNENALEINDAARRCRRLIQGLLRFARRPRALELGPVDLGQVLDEIRPLLDHRLAVASVTLEINLPVELPRVRGQVADVEHMLVDLLVNALDACEAGDRIVVRARAPGPGARLDGPAGTAQVELVVEDSGLGMEPEVLAAAFTPFFTTKGDSKDQRGTGLGLTTCEAIAAQMGGSIALESTPGEGTRAVLHLPQHLPHHDGLLSEPAEPAEPVKPAKPAEPAENRRTRPDDEPDDAG